jgi:hypothetical protein
MAWYTSTSSSWSSDNWALAGFFDALDRWGFTDVLLPFLLVFTLVFAVLEKVKILGEGKRNFNVIIALVMAFVTIVPHIIPNPYIPFDPVEVINGALPQVSILVVAIIMLMILIGVFAHDKIFLGLTAPGWIGFFSLIAIVFIFGSAAGWWGGDVSSSLEQFFGEDALAIVIMILVFGIIIAFITHDSEKDRTVGAWNKLGVNFKELFGDKK